ncbi:hypothetical protein CFH99_09000 [Nocardioides aromaticivorans]|uniref:DUF4352 domain-containing protein n=1 Tax=Nocardioides aromaticivorans TaxID=200618 RepID=A0ABX7PIG5_9ACTN|nr:hypothetical protein [Nocardioides aromaticivorans]QSR25758.1 hypothetical protein CFH99_09000 [Nocardioides aromaticivorans]
MDTTVRRPAPVGETTRWTLLLVLVLCAATVYGGQRALSLLDPAHHAASPHGHEAPPTLQLGDARVEVVAAEEVVGVAGTDLMGGMGHDISGWVTADQMMVQVWLRVSAGDRAAAYDPSQLRAFAAGSTTPIVPASGSLGTGTLTPHAMVEGSVSFVVPRTDARLSLGTATSDHSVAIPAVPGSSGRTAPTPGDDEHHH